MRVDRYEEEFGKHPGRTSIRIGVTTIAVVFVLLVVGFLGVFIFGWFSTTANIYSAGNVKAQYQFGYDYDRAMAATARNVCIAKQTGLEASALAAYEQTYSNIEGQYDARMADKFRAQRVKPSDLPLVAPTLQDRVNTLKSQGTSC